MVGVRLVRSSSQIPGYPHIHIFMEPCSTSHETTDTLAGMTDGAQYSQTLHERSVLTANMCLEAQQRTTRPLVFALTTALDILGIERPDEKTITLTNTEKMHVHVTASDLGDEEKERMLALRVASKIGQHLSQRVGIHERHYPSMALGFGTLIAGRVMGRLPPECRGRLPVSRSVPETSVCETPRRAGHRLHPPNRRRHPPQNRTGRLTKLAQACMKRIRPASGREDGRARCILSVRCRTVVLVVIRELVPYRVLRQPSVVLRD